MTRPEKPNQDPDEPKVSRLRFSRMVRSLLEGVRNGSLHKTTPDKKVRSKTKRGGRRTRDRTKKTKKEEPIPGIRLSELLATTGHSGFGFLIGFLAFVAIPFVGASAPFGLAIAGLGVQMAFRRHEPWLPGFLERREIPYRILLRVSNILGRLSLRIERWIKPRYVGLTRGPFWSLIGFMLVFLGLGLALPLPIPASNLVFIVPILVYSLAILEEDGALAMFGHAIVSVFVILGILFWKIVWQALAKLF